MRRKQYLFEVKDQVQLKSLLNNLGPKRISQITKLSISNVYRRLREDIPWKLEELIALEHAAGLEEGTLWQLTTNAPLYDEWEAWYEMYLTCYLYFLEKDREKQRERQRQRYRLKKAKEQSNG